MNKFLSQHIDRAIVYTQFELRGNIFFGTRIKGNEAKTLSSLLYNLGQYAAGYNQGGSENITIEKKLIPSFSFENSTYKNHFTFYKKLADECGIDQKEAIQFIIKSVLIKRRQLAKKATNAKEELEYLKPLTNKRCPDVRVTLAMMAAFDVKEDKPVKIKIFPEKKK